MNDRAPWWYSGDDESPETGAADEPSADASPSDSSPGGAGTDWLALLSGAQRVVDWATERVMAPHAAHGDPHDFPQCVICRTLLLLGETAPRAGAEAAQDGFDTTEVRGSAVIEWIPVRDRPEGP
jgi:hypothetical protein